MEEISKKKYRFRAACGWISLLVAITIFAVHWFQFDSLAPVTLVPPWLWLVPAFLLTAVSSKGISRAFLLGIIIAWSIFFVLFAEEARSLVRLGRPTLSVDGPEKGGIRVASLNCNVGKVQAALEVGQFNPDIVLLQESPGADRASEIGAALFGDNASFVDGGDAAIIVNGMLEPSTVDGSRHFVHAVATLNGGQVIDIVSLRLSPPVFRMDFWETGFWEDHRKTRKKHRSQLQAVMDYLEQHQVTPNLIIGGDFNMVGNDSAFSPFAGLSDTFKEAGVGWCNTGTNDYPLFRVDQIWTSNGFVCNVMKAYQTENSDHRMIFADVQVVGE